MKFNRNDFPLADIILQDLTNPGRDILIADINAAETNDVTAVQNFILGIQMFCIIPELRATIMRRFPDATIKVLQKTIDSCLATLKEIDTNDARSLYKNILINKL